MTPDVWYGAQPDNFDYVRFSKDGARPVLRADVVQEVLRDFNAGRLRDAGVFPAAHVREQAKQKRPT